MNNGSRYSAGSTAHKALLSICLATRLGKGMALKMKQAMISIP
jgi:hypothetical protein